MPRKRLDVLVVESGQASSRSQAQALIKAGQVRVHNANGWCIVDKPAFELDSSQAINVTPAKYVSRGGLKMESALQHLNLSVRGCSILDIGISTGGFTDCLLQAGAAQIVGVDVGHNQLAEKLKSEARLRHFEGVNARGLDLGQRFDLIVVDVSFISLSLIVPQLPRHMVPKGQLLALVKPQFELSPASLNKKGIVKDPETHKEVEGKIRQVCESSGLKVLDFFPCGIEGGDGNQEYFIYACECGATDKL